MRYKKLGNTPLNLSEIGIGTWAIGGEGYDYSWGKQDDDISCKTILNGFQLGINWIDTAPVYGLGHSEEIVAKTLKKWKEKIVVATKCGLLWNEHRKVYSSLKKQSIKKELETSLKRLDIDIIDIYQIHWPDPLCEIEEAFSAMQELKNEGKIKYTSVSNFSIKQMERIKQYGNIASLQPPYSLLNRRIEDGIIDYCKENKIGLISYSPLQNGFLTEKTTKEWISKLDDDDWRKTKSSFFREPDLKWNLLFLDKLKKFANERGKTVAELAIAWILSQDEVTSVIVGARSPLQIEQTFSSVNWKLSKEDLTEIEILCLEHKNNLKNNIF